MIDEKILSLLSYIYAIVTFNFLSVPYINMYYEYLIIKEIKNIQCQEKYKNAICIKHVMYRLLKSYITLTTYLYIKYIKY